MSVNLNFRTEEATRDAIDKLAASIDRDRSWVINPAVKDYLDDNAWQIEQIMEGLRDIEEGRTVSPEEVKEHFKQKYAKAKAAEDKKNGIAKK
jgi:predicted transcriptional regulator